MQSVIDLFFAGGFVMYPLLICSLAIWAVIFERLWKYRRLGQDLRAFHLQAMNSILKDEPKAIFSLCAAHPDLPTSRLLTTAIDRLSSKDERARRHWLEALERQRQMINLELRQNFWILGTVASAAPFIGLFGTVMGILQSFGDIARTGSGGFAIVASGISEALIATAAGIVVAVIAVMAFNAFQSKWGALVLMIRIQIEELVEYLEDRQPGAS